MDVKEFYTNVKGNYQGALSIMMNDMFIARMLSKFMSSDAVNQLISLYEQKDYRGVFASAHSLKGVAGNLSLTPLYDIASTITEATRNSDDVDITKEILELKKIYELIKEQYQKYIA